MKANQDIRRLARVSDVALWRIAREIGVSEPTLTRWLRDPLDESRKARIVDAISRLSVEVDD